MNECWCLLTFFFSWRPTAPSTSLNSSKATPRSSTNSLCSLKNLPNPKILMPTPLSQVGTLLMIPVLFCHHHRWFAVLISFFLAWSGGYPPLGIHSSQGRLEKLPEHGRFYLGHCVTKKNKHLLSENSPSEKSRQEFAAAAASEGSDSETDLAYNLLQWPLWYAHLLPLFSVLMSFDNLKGACFCSYSFMEGVCYEWTRDESKIISLLFKCFFPAKLLNKNHSFLLGQLLCFVSGHVISVPDVLILFSSLSVHRHAAKTVFNNCSLSYDVETNFAYTPATIGDVFTSEYKTWYVWKNNNVFLNHHFLFISFIPTPWFLSFPLFLLQRFVFPQHLSSLRPQPGEKR